MRVLVTGGAGFIGSHLVEGYLSRGDEVAILDNFSTGRESNLPVGVEIFRVDLVDENEVLRAVSTWQPELINHHAAHISVTDSTARPSFNAMTNILGSIHLFEAARKCDVRRIIVASTGGALYGEADVRPTPENVRTVPLSPYGLSKLSMEQYLEYYHKLFDLETVVLRYANVYGPRQGGSAETGVVATFVKLALSNGQPTIYGDGLQTRDYVYVADVVAANLAASAKGTGAYNVGTGAETSVLDVLHAVADAATWHATPIFASARPGEVLHSSLDSTRAQMELGWKPEVKFSEGVTQTYAAEKQRAEE